MVDRQHSHLDTLRPSILAEMLDTPVFLSSSLALCYVKNGTVYTAAVTIHKRRPDGRWQQKLRSVPGGAWDGSTDENVLYTAAREFVEEIFGAEDHDGRIDRLYNELVATWPSSSYESYRLSCGIDLNENLHYDDLNVHVSLRLLINDDSPWIDDVKHKGMGHVSQHEKTSEIAWDSLSVLQGKTPTWYRWGIRNDSVETDRLEWRFAYHYVVPSEIRRLLL